MTRISQVLILVFGLILFALLTGLAFADGGGGGGGGSNSIVHKTDVNLEKAKMAIKDQEWGRAIVLLNLSAANDNNNADVQNLLGFAERKRGNLDAAFIHYERALVLDPKHRGAHEYLGEAYLMAGNLAKAEEQLAALDKLCFFSCEEYRDLKVAIADYQKGHLK